MQKSMRGVNLQLRLAQSRLFRVAATRRTQSRTQRQATANMLLNLQYKVSLQPFPTIYSQLNKSNGPHQEITLLASECTLSAK